MLVSRVPGPRRPGPAMWPVNFPVMPLVRNSASAMRRDGGWSLTSLPNQLIINRNVPEIGMHFFRIRSITGGNSAWNPREWSHNPDLALNRRSGAGVFGGI